jgi:arylsulfatase A-like enzyme
MLPELPGESRRGRDRLVEHSRGIAIRKGHWKPVFAGNNVEAKSDAPLELYDLDADIGETRNVAAENPQVVRELMALMEKVRTSGHSRPI